MLELVPKWPFEDLLYAGNLLSNTRYVYKQIGSILKPEHLFLSTALPPKFGTPSSVKTIFPDLKSTEELVSQNKSTLSEYMSDKIINSHPRFPTLTQNCRIRRGEKPQIEAPIFKDEKTNMTEVLPGEKKPGKIFLDAFSFGMGLCSLQVTFAVPTLKDARWLYDQFHMFTPIFVSFDITLSLHCQRRCHSIKESFSTRIRDGSSFANHATIGTKGKESKAPLPNQDTDRYRCSSRMTQET